MISEVPPSSKIILCSEKQDDYKNSSVRQFLKKVIIKLTWELYTDNFFTSSSTTKGQLLN